MTLETFCFIVLHKAKFFTCYAVCIFLQKRIFPLSLLVIFFSKSTIALASNLSTLQKQFCKMYISFNIDIDFLSQLLFSHSLRIYSISFFSKKFILFSAIVIYSDKFLKSLNYLTYFSFYKIKNNYLQDYSPFFVQSSLNLL